MEALRDIVTRLTHHTNIDASWSCSSVPATTENPELEHAKDRTGTRLSILHLSIGLITYTAVHQSAID